jgi:hypothetical protein
MRPAFDEPHIKRDSNVSQHPYRRRMTSQLANIDENEIRSIVVDDEPCRDGCDYGSAETCVR